MVKSMKINVFINQKKLKINNYYFENSNQIWKKCEINKNNFICSICPKGTFIKDSSSQICEKCEIGKYSNKEDNSNCLKCPDGYTSLPGSSYCFLDYEPGYYSYNNKCIPCKPGFYSEGSSIECFRMYSRNIYK